jgi:hypothetical protein
MKKKQNNAAHAAHGEYFSIANYLPQIPAIIPGIFRIFRGISKYLRIYTNISRETRFESTGLDIGFSLQNLGFSPRLRYVTQWYFTSFQCELLCLSPLSSLCHFSIFACHSPLRCAIILPRHHISTLRVVPCIVSPWSLNESWRMSEKE